MFLITCTCIIYYTQSPLINLGKHKTPPGIIMLMQGFILEIVQSEVKHLSELGMYIWNVHLNGHRVRSAASGISALDSNQHSTTIL